MLGDEAPWDLPAHLLASVLDALHVANWQRAGKGPRPQRVPRPGVGTTRRLGADPDADPDTVRTYLDRFKPPPPDAA